MRGRPRLYMRNDKEGDIDRSRVYFEGLPIRMVIFGHLRSARGSHLRFLGTSNLSDRLVGVRVQKSLFSGVRVEICNGKN